MQKRGLIGFPVVYEATVTTKFAKQRGTIILMWFQIPDRVTYAGHVLQAVHCRYWGCSWRHQSSWLVNVLFSQCIYHHRFAALHWQICSAIEAYFISFHSNKTRLAFDALETMLCVPHSEVLPTDIVLLEDRLMLHRLLLLFLQQAAVGRHITLVRLRNYW